MNIMKIITTLLFLLSITLTSYGQESRPTDKGHSMIGGSIYGSYSRYDVDYSVIQFGILPSYARFIANGFAIGPSISMSYYKNSGPANFYRLSETKYISGGVGVNLSYYMKCNIFFRTHGEISGRFLYHTNTPATYNENQGITPGIGYAFFANDHTSIEPSLNARIGYGSTGLNILFAIKFKAFYNRI